MTVSMINRLFSQTRTLPSRHLFFIGVTGLVVMLLSALLPGTAFSIAPDTYLLTHTIFETFSIVIALMVFSLIWSSRQFHSYQDVFIGSSLIAVAILDAVHIFSFPGMSGFVIKDATRTTIFFWLMARYLS